MNDFESNLNHLLVETFNNILKYEEVSLKKALNAPITITETHIIEAVGPQENNETTVSKIASIMGVTMPTATVAIKKLESKGFIKKIPSEIDGRCTIISLTENGRKIERIHRLFHERMVRNISSQFIDSEKSALLKAITKLNVFFKEKVEA